MWRDFPEKLTQLTGCPALVYSRQGYGRSDSCIVPRPLNYMTIEALEVLPKLLDATNIRNHILIGHSDGGSISLIYAGAKKRVQLQGIITMAPHVFCERISVASIAEAKLAYFEGNLRSGLEKYHYDNVDCAFLGWNRAWLDPDFMQWNIEKYLPGINVPQLIIQGENDQYGTVAQVDSIEEKSGSTVTVHILENCQHSPHKEQKEQSLRLMQDFIKNTYQKSF